MTQTQRLLEKIYEAIEKINHLPSRRYWQQMTFYNRDNWKKLNEIYKQVKDFLKYPNN